MCETNIFETITTNIINNSENNEWGIIEFTIDDDRNSSPCVCVFKRHEWDDDIDRFIAISDSFAIVFDQSENNIDKISKDLFNKIKHSDLNGIDLIIVSINEKCDSNFSEMEKEISQNKYTKCYPYHTEPVVSFISSKEDNALETYASIYASLLNECIKKIQLDMIVNGEDFNAFDIRDELKSKKQYSSVIDALEAIGYDMYHMVKNTHDFPFTLKSWLSNKYDFQSTLLFTYSMMTLVLDNDCNVYRFNPIKYGEFKDVYKYQFDTVIPVKHSKEGMTILDIFDHKKENIELKDNTSLICEYMKDCDTFVLADIDKNNKHVNNVTIVYHDPMLRFKYNYSNGVNVFLKSVLCKDNGICVFTQRKIGDIIYSDASPKYCDSLHKCEDMKRFLWDNLFPYHCLIEASYGRDDFDEIVSIVESTLSSFYNNCVVKLMDDDDEFKNNMYIHSCNYGCGFEFGTRFSFSENGINILIEDRKERRNTDNKIPEALMRELQLDDEEDA